MRPLALRAGCPGDVSSVRGDTSQGFGVPHEGKSAGRGFVAGANRRGALAPEPAHPHRAVVGRDQRRRAPAAGGRHRLVRAPADHRGRPPRHHRQHPGGRGPAGHRPARRGHHHQRIVRFAGQFQPGSGRAHHHPAGDGARHARQRRRPAGGRTGTARPGRIRALHQRQRPGSRFHRRRLRLPRTGLVPAHRVRARRLVVRTLPQPHRGRRLDGHLQPSAASAGPRRDDPWHGQPGRPAVRTHRQLREPGQPARLAGLAGRAGRHAGRESRCGGGRQPHPGTAHPSRRTPGPATGRRRRAPAPATAVDAYRRPDRRETLHRGRADRPERMEPAGGAVLRADHGAPGSGAGLAAGRRSGAGTALHAAGAAAGRPHQPAGRTADRLGRVSGRGPLRHPGALYPPPGRGRPDGAHTGTRAHLHPAAAGGNRGDGRGPAEAGERTGDRARHPVGDAAARTRHRSR